MFSTLIGIALAVGLVGYKVGVYYKLYKFSKKRPKIPPYQKVVKLDMYRQYRIK